MTSLVRRTHDGRLLWECTVHRAPPARPIAYAWEGKIIDLSGVLEQTRILTRHWEERGSAFLLQQISYTKLSEWSSYSYWAVDESSSSLTSHVWSNSYWPVTLINATFMNFSRRCIHLCRFVSKKRGDSIARARGPLS